MKEIYGGWTVLGPSPDKKYYSLCQCSCGVVRDVNNGSLTSGRSTSCGHSIGETIRKTKYKEMDDKIIGKRFGRLIATERVKEHGESKYLCICDCGNKVEVTAQQLLSGRTISCGCYRQETSLESMGKIKEIGQNKNREGQVEGTNIYSLEQKISKNNKTGVKGVCEMKNGKYRAYINLSRKQINLGIFDTIKEAKEARLQAEIEIHVPIITRHKNPDKK